MAIEDEAGVALELSERGDDRWGMGADEADGEAPESGGVFGAVTGTDSAANGGAETRPRYPRGERYGLRLLRGVETSNALGLGEPPLDLEDSLHGGNSVEIGCCFCRELGRSAIERGDVATDAFDGFAQGADSARPGACTLDHVELRFNRLRSGVGAKAEIRKSSRPPLLAQ